MTDWMLYEFAKTYDMETIQIRLAWYEKQGKQWLAEFTKARNDLGDAQTRIDVSEQQVKCYASQVAELTQLAKERGKL